MFRVKSPAGKPNWDPFWIKGTRPAPQGRKGEFGNQPSVVLWDPDQPLFGPVVHKRVNWRDLPEPLLCTEDTSCSACRETEEYNQWQRTLAIPSVHSVDKR